MLISNNAPRYDSGLWGGLYAEVSRDGNDAIIKLIRIKDSKYDGARKGARWTNHYPTDPLACTNSIALTVGWDEGADIIKAIRKANKLFMLPKDCVKYNSRAMSGTEAVFTYTLRNVLPDVEADTHHVTPIPPHSLPNLNLIEIVEKQPRKLDETRLRHLLTQINRFKVAMGNNLMLSLEQNKLVADAVFHGDVL